MTMWQPNITSGDRPRYLALADAIEEGVAEGRLVPGQRLPTHRDLAEALGVTVGTVTRGYAEAARRGLVRGEVGRGTVVMRGGEGPCPWWGASQAGSGQVGVAGHAAKASAGGSQVVDMGLVTGLTAHDPDLGAALASLATRPDIQQLLRYQPSGGLPRHREAGVSWLARHGVQAEPGQVVVTSGGQHALLVTLSALFRPGDRVLCAGLNYPGLMSVAALLGLRLVPVDSDAEGLLPAAIEDACAREDIRGLYLMPGMHNPTCARMEPERLARMAELARRHDLSVIEDGAYALTGPDGPDKPCRPLAPLIPERCFYVASVSKMLTEGLRVAYVAAPPEFTERLSLGITSTTWMASPLCAELAALWIGDGTADAVLARKRGEAQRRVRLAARLLEGFGLRTRPMGYFAWLPLPEPWRGEEFERAALERGVAVVAGGSFAVGQTPAPMAVRLSLSAPRTEAELERGLTVLAELLRQPPRQGRAIV